MTDFLGFAGVQPEDLRTVVVNAAYRIVSTDRVVAQTGTMSASRVFLLPRASSMQPGQEIVVVDESGTVTTVNTIVVTRQAADTIGAGTTLTINAAYGARRLVSDGLSKWTAIAATPVGITELSATGAASATTFLRGDNSWATPAGGGSSDPLNAEFIISGRMFGR